MSEQARPEEHAVPPWTQGWRLQRALGYGGVSVSDMAESLQLSRATLSRWMADKGVWPREVYLKHWAWRCGVSYEWLCHGTTEPCDTRPLPAAVAGTGGRGYPGSNALAKINMQRYLSRKALERVA